jgi:hypothetical protein
MSSTQEAASSSGSNSGNNSNGTTPTPAPSTGTAATSSGSSTGSDENLACRWKDCTDHFESPERLYDHICDKHVGRKSTNNLNLTCMWNSCRTTTVKRDHITSHIRVHVPLKPHKCDFCGKSFKRPQDLKKHVKTHADDSILTSRPGPDQNGAGMNAGFRPHHHAPKTPASYYDHTGQIRTNAAAYGQGPQNGGSYYSHHPAPSAYQPMYAYQQPMGNGRGDFMAHQAAPAYDNRKRGLDELNDFFGALKRRQVDTSNYASVGRSLMPIHSTSMGMQAGGGGGLATEYMAPAHQHPPALSVGGGPAQHGPLTQHYYLPPMPNLRTKDDLRDIDHILQQMQATVYENTGSPESTQYAAVDMRHHSPAYATRPSIDPYAVPAPQVASPLTSVSSTQSTGTPAVTPPSSSMSYTSGHSPGASSSGMSPTSRHNSTSVAYPSLPAVAHPQSSLSGLGTSFTSTERRLSGGVLQSANAAARSREASEGATTPRAGASTPASAGSPSGESDSSESPETYDSWIHNMRLIETLRRAIRDRLENREYDETSGDESRIDPMVLDADKSRAPPAMQASIPTREKSLYPTLPNWS